MITFSREFYDVPKSVAKKIDRLYNGKAIPNTNKVHVCNVSSCTDTNLMSLCVYWNMMVQNTYSKDFRCIIVSSDTNSESPADTLIQSIDSVSSSEGFFDRDVTEVIDLSDLADIIKTSKTPKKKEKDNAKALLLAINDTRQDLEKIVSVFKPDIIIFDEFKIEKEMIIDITNYLNSVKQYMNTSVIALTKYDLTETDTKSLPQAEVVYRTSTCFEKMIENHHSLHIKLVDLENDTDHPKTVAKLDEILESADITIADMSEYSLKKRVLVVSKNRVTSDDLFEKYQKIFEDFPTVGAIRPFNGADEKDVLRFAEGDCEDSTNKTNNQKVIFVSSSDLVDVYEISEHALRNIDCLIVLDPNFKNDSVMYLKVITTLVSNNNTDSTLLFVEVVNEPLHQQLHRLSKIFYNPDSTNVQIFHAIIDSIDSGRITVDSGLASNNSKKKNAWNKFVENLEEALEITDRDKQFDVRHNIVYIVHVPKSKLSQVRTTYENEEQYIRSNISDEVLNNEFDAIFNAKKGARNIPHYSGPKWISTDNTELQGSKIGFAHDDRDCIEVCEILGVRPYTRREKRGNWKEKDCKNKNVLYLSTLRGEYKLSSFKKQFKIPLKEKIEHMRDFEFEFDFEK
ncbi:hypothetical protein YASMINEVIRUS_160 [Yasminevirus sp. GU-2018]|uniref:Uncharacterized protein n=1 Tax=Yasminevirus sp. GU-2018 TaxID=2420051 RepID=A0A5K0U7G2_9VIRU|nr:hypothetical protein YASMINEVIRUS_160 [Yasminevirus sp. GU-2018]